MILSSLYSVSAIKVNISDPLFIIILIVVFITASVISGIITFKIKTKKIRKDTDSSSDNQK